MLRREFRLRGRLAHPQVPGAYELGRDEAKREAFLLLDYAEGEGLIEAVARLGDEVVPTLFAQALNVVGWLHGAASSTAT